MAEPVCGTGSPVWSAGPSPGLASLQTPIAGNSGIGSPQPPTTTLGPGPSNLLTSPMTAPFSTLGAPEATGVTAPALLMAVAIRRGQPAGPTTDQDVEDFIYDALDLLPGAGDVEVRCEGGRVTLAGTVSQKRLKRDAAQIAWAIPAISDVSNTITIAPRRRSRTQNREPEPASVAGRKPA